MTTGQFDPIPDRVQTLIAVTRVRAGELHTCARTGDGGVWCWGDDSAGELGDGRSGSGIQSLAPLRVGLVPAATDVAVGTGYSCMADTDSVLCWGSDKHGQLGDGFFVDRPMVGQVHGVGAPLSIAAAVFDTCALQVDGKLYCWGSNATGQVGTGSTMQDNPLPDVVRMMCR
jgi:alpha-tubulin suppressor-like RCC1 family protein